jgi:hypothetical protein
MSQPQFTENDQRELAQVLYYENYTWKLDDYMAGKEN